MPSFSRVSFPFIFVVAILAAIAIPAYQDYTIRAQVSEGLNLAAAAKVAVAESLLEKHEVPVDRSEAGLSPAATDTSGQVRRAASTSPAARSS